MNELQLATYNNLMKLTETEQFFYYTDQILNDTKYRIFLYNNPGLIRYDTWKKESALEARGITFQMSSNHHDNDAPVKLVSWPFEKFFNLNENPMTTHLDLSNPREILVKEDGSLISTVLCCSSSQDNSDTHHLWLKSRGSLHSAPARQAMALLNNDGGSSSSSSSSSSSEYRQLKAWLQDMVIHQQCTVNLEYTGPGNRVVLEYPQPKLTVLSVRSHHDGSYRDMYNDISSFSSVRQFLARNILVDKEDVDDAFIAAIPGQTNMEGYVITLANGQRVKIKTQWYLAVLHNEFKLLSDQTIGEAILMDQMDDIRAHCCSSPELLQRIDTVTHKVMTVYGDMLDQVEGFYQTHKTLRRHDYAALAQRTLGHHYRLAMNRYNGQYVDYRGTLLRQCKKFGIESLFLPKQ